VREAVLKVSLIGASQLRTGATVYYSQDEEPFSITSVKPHHKPVDISNHPMSDLRQVFYSTLLNSSSRSPNFSSTPTELSADYRVGLTDVLTTNARRRFDPRFRAAKNKEIKGLARHGTWRVVCAEDLPDNANVMRGRFVLTIKNINTGKEIGKARFVVQGHKDSRTFSLLHKAATLHIRSIRLFSV
jgi:hypothetical protein